MSHIEDMASSSSADTQPSYLKKILRALGSVKRPGLFAIGGEVTLPFPALKIDGIPGTIGLPVSEQQAKIIIEKCNLAPFGGEEDPSRPCQLDPHKLSISNPKWKKGLNSLLLQVKAELGCSSTQDVSCQFREFLLYKPGSVLKFHQDTEEDGMFGTLVIQLLSEFTGGELIVRYRRQEKRFRFDGLAGCVNFHYAAFYADCQHELTEVTSGHRLCLVYNLVCRRSDTALVPAEYQQAVNAVTSSIKNWEKDSAGPDYIVYLLKQEYSQTNLAFQVLKDMDRAVGDVLVEAQRVVDFDFYLAHLCTTQVYLASDLFDGFEWLRDQSTEASHFAAPGSQMLPSADSMYLEEDRLYPKKLFKFGEPDDEKFEEASEYNRAEVSRLYYRTAFILWPAAKRMKMIGLNRMTEKIKDMIDDEEILSEEKRKECIELAEAIVTCSVQGLYISTSSAAILLQCLQVLNDIELTNRFVASCDLNQRIKGDSGFCDQLVSFFSTLPLKDVEPKLVGIIKDGCSYPDGVCTLLTKLFEHAPSSPSPSEYLALCKSVTSDFCKAARNTIKCVSVDHIIKVLGVLLEVKETALLSEFLEVVISAVCVGTLVKSEKFSEIISSISKMYSWEVLVPGLSALFTKAPSDIVALCVFLRQLVLPSVSGEQKTVCQGLLSTVTSVLAEGKVTDIYFDLNPRSGFMLLLLKLILALDLDDSLVNVIDAFLQRPKRYPLLVLINAIVSVFQWVGKERGAVLTPVILKVKAAIETELSKPEPKGQSKKALKELGYRQKLSLQKENLIKIVNSAKSSDTVIKSSQASSVTSMVTRTTDSVKSSDTVIESSQASSVTSRVTRTTGSVKSSDSVIESSQASSVTSRVTRAKTRAAARQASESGPRTKKQKISSSSGAPGMEQ